jgi:AraC-like DNA-binding protein
MKRQDLWLIEKDMENPQGISAFTTIPESFKGQMATHNHPFHELIYMLDGEAKQICDSRIYQFLPGDLYFFKAGDKHIAAGNPTAVCIVINFYDSSFSESNIGDKEALQVIQALKNRTLKKQYRIKIEAEYKDIIKNILQEIVAENESYQPGMKAAVKCSLQMLLIYLWRLTDLIDEIPKDLPVNISIHKEAINQVILFIQQNFSEKIQINDLVEISGMCRSLLCTAFKKQTGMTIINYLNRLRISKSSLMLETTTIPIPQLAESAGFSSESHFYSVFKSHTGISPHAYRLMMVKKQER